MTFNYTCFVVGAFAAFIALLAANIPVPKRGRKITNNRYYNVNVSWLQSSDDHWATTLISHHEAATKLSRSFVLSTLDEATIEFLGESASRSHVMAYLKQKLYWGLQMYFGWSASDSSAFLDMFSLYVASEQQLTSLVEKFVSNASSTFNGFRALAPRLLDVGSGKGTETAKLATVFDIPNEDVTCIETSNPLRRQLSQKKIRTGSSLVDIGTENFSVAALLNVLDRCDEPASLLNATVRRVEADGVLVIATVLPFHGQIYEGRIGGRNLKREPLVPLTVHDNEVTDEAITEVEYEEEGKQREDRTHQHHRRRRHHKTAGSLIHQRSGNRMTHAKKGNIGIGMSEGSFERHAAVFLEAIVREQPHLELSQWTRLPYLSSGDTGYTHYVLDMAVMAFRVRPRDAL